MAKVIYDMNTEILEALGLKGQHIGKLEFRMAADDFPTVMIERLLTGEDVEKLVPVLERYSLVPKNT